MKKIIFPILVVLFIGMAAFGQKKPNAIDSKLTNVSMILKDNVIFFELKINGSRPLNFMFDTGAGVTVLNSSSAIDVLLTYSGASTIKTSGNKMRVLSTIDNEIQIGGLTLDDVTIELIQLDHLSAYFDIPVDGIIGYDLFSRYVVKTDLDDLLLSLHDSAESIDLSGWHREEVFRADHRKIGLNVSVLTKGGGYSDQLMTVDTGHPNALTLFPQALENKLDLLSSSKSAQGFSADSTVTTNKRAILKRIRFANKKWKNIRTTLTTDPISINAFSENAAKGLIGQELLLDFNIVYDYKNNFCYLSKRE